MATCRYILGKRFPSIFPLRKLKQKKVNELMTLCSILGLESCTLYIILKLCKEDWFWLIDFKQTLMSTKWVNWFDAYILGQLFFKKIDFYILTIFTIWNKQCFHVKTWWKYIDCVIKVAKLATWVFRESTRFADFVTQISIICIENCFWRKGLFHQLIV